eukprot:m.174525 g.174525  ORF g.174525 m.174525 type:complete len:748 (-) comp15322_c1_seq4:162-2405(-)
MRIFSLLSLALLAALALNAAAQSTSEYEFIDDGYEADGEVPQALGNSASLTQLRGVVNWLVSAFLKTRSTLYKMRSNLNTTRHFLRTTRSRLASETSRAVAAEAVTRTLTRQINQTTLQTLASERTRAMAAEDAINMQIVANSATQTSSLDAEIHRSITAETSIRITIGFEHYRASAVEASLQTALEGEISRAKIVEEGLDMQIDGASETLGAQLAETRSTAAAAAAEQAVALVAEVQRGLAVEASLRVEVEAVETQTAAIQTQLSTAESADLSGAILLESSRAQASLEQEISRAKSAESNIGDRIDPAVSAAAVRNAYRDLANPGALFTAVPFNCTPTDWGTTVGAAPGTAGCSFTTTLTGPSIILASLNGHARANSANNWYYTAISINGDNEMNSGVVFDMPGQAVYGPALGYATYWQNHRAVRSRYIAHSGPVTIQGRFISLNGNTNINGYSMHGLIITTSLPIAGLTGTFMCASNTWETPIVNAAGRTLCTVPFFMPFASMVYSFFGGHMVQSTTAAVPSITQGTYGWVGFDGLNQGNQSAQTYASLNAAYALNNPEFEPFNSGRTTTLARGAHNASLNFFAPVATGNTRFNGGGLSGFYLPLDNSISVPQTFSCNTANTMFLGTSGSTLCILNVTLPYRAVVWADFTMNVRTTSVNEWVAASISFNNDADSAIFTLNTSDKMLWGMAHTYSANPIAIGHGRATTLNAGTHKVAVIGRSSATNSGIIHSLGMTGFFVRALPTF